jgi:ABC-2 type transport system permease protein
VTTAAARGRLALVLHQSRYDLRGFIRNRQARFFTLALPLLFLVIFVSIFGNDYVGDTHIKASTYYVPGISALAIIAASFVNLVISIVVLREEGILKRRRATPMPAWR